MSSHLIRLHPSGLIKRCEMYGCKNTSFGGNKLYQIGIPNHLSPKPAICEHCIAAIMGNLPEEVAALVGVSSNDSAIVAEKDELIAKRDVLIDEKDAQIEGLLVEIATLTLQLTPSSDQEPDPSNDIPPEVVSSEPVPGATDEPIVNGVDPEDEKDENELFRCLDCGEEYKSKGALTRHIHKEHPEN